MKQTIMWMNSMSFYASNAFQHVGLPLHRNLSLCVSYKWKLCNVEKTEGEKKKNPLPSVAASHYMSEDSLSLTSSTADNPQITGSYFIISCRSVPHPSPPPWLSDMWRERRREWETLEKQQTYCRWVERVYRLRDRIVWAAAEKENIAVGIKVIFQTILNVCPDIKPTELSVRTK